MIRVFFMLVLLSMGKSSLAQEIPSPSEYLGYPLGSRFSFHHQAVGYFQAVAAASPQVRYQPYGQTYEGRPLGVAIVGQAATLAQLDTLRLAHLASLEGAARPDSLPAIVWLSYNIHGDEASSMEAAMATLHRLLAPEHAPWLKKLIIVLDPCTNPDGRDRYAVRQQQRRGRQPQVDGNALEHHQQWPDGRYNHYLFDLNRDWCWQTQQESRQRAVLFHQWRPHVHVDFHEMGNAHYFFAPSPEPIHPLITDWQRRFQSAVGTRHARYFDQRGWMYFTRESYDLFYPSYGDTWPGFQGAMGFTYEQWGSGPASLARTRPNGDTVTLGDRIDRHLLTGLSTVETAYDQAEALQQGLVAYTEQARKGRNAQYQSYIMRASGNPARLAALRTVLDRNQIRYGYVRQDLTRKYAAYGYRLGGETVFSPRAGDLVVPVAQTQGNLVQALFEPVATLKDSLTYDLTAWALPFAYNIDGYALSERIAFGEDSMVPPPTVGLDTLPYAYLLRWGDVAQARFVSLALQAGVTLRYATEPFTLAGQDFGRGTILLAQSDQQGDILAKLGAVLKQAPVKLIPVQTGRVSQGRDLGSASYRLIKPGRIGLLWGNSLSETALGAVWHTLDEVLQYPVELLGTDYLSRVDLSDYQTLILPDGDYSEYASQLRSFAAQGGRIIALEGALRLFSSVEAGQGSTDLAQAMTQQKPLPSMLQHAIQTSKRYGDQERDALRQAMPGAIYQARLDTTHPIAFGASATYQILKQTTQVYPQLQSGWNVGTFTDIEPISGFSGSALRGRFRHTLAIGSESFGQGELIYFVESPVFRGFWHSGLLLFSNALFFN